VRSSFLRVQIDGGRLGDSDHRGLPLCGSKEWGGASAPKTESEPRAGIARPWPHRLPGGQTATLDLEGQTPAELGHYHDRVAGARQASQHGRWDEVSGLGPRCIHPRRNARTKAVRARLELKRVA
jgi:hypothetical protein